MAKNSNAIWLNGVYAAIICFVMFLVYALGAHYGRNYGEEIKHWPKELTIKQRKILTWAVEQALNPSDDVEKANQKIWEILHNLD